MLFLMHFVIFGQTVHHNAYHEDPYAKEFGIKISEKLAQVEARILPPPWVFLYFIFLSISFIHFELGNISFLI